MNNKCPNCGSELENIEGKLICWCCGYITWEEETILEVVENE